MHLTDVENALILVGKNNAGKSSVLDAVRAVGGQYQITEDDFHPSGQNIEIGITLSITREDLKVLHSEGIVSQYTMSGKKDLKNGFLRFRTGALRSLLSPTETAGSYIRTDFRKIIPIFQRCFPKFIILTRNGIFPRSRRICLSARRRSTTSMSR